MVITQALVSQWLEFYVGTTGYIGNEFNYIGITGYTSNEFKLHVHACTIAHDVPVVHNL